MQMKKSLSRYWVLVAVCMAGLILPLEYTGPAVALPAIQNELGGSGIALSWVINAFALSFGSAVMAAGALADQYGRKKMFVIGIAGFTLFSVIVSVAGNVVFLDLVRGLQGFFAALTMAGGNASLAQEFDGRARTKAFWITGNGFWCWPGIRACDIRCFSRDFGLAFLFFCWEPYSGGLH
ncbi:MFS transporter [Xenorhabdus nematophila]|uniref:MFS transporter n=1 Tax=Xenorhabdus nematophila TaxID=628 RepID=UPI000A4115DD|nr:MFS transporter [Xenorhabdus nematophila]